MAERPRILYVVSGTCARGLMAEGLTRYLAGQMVDVETAGPFESAIDPYCQWAMNEAGIDVSLISVEPLDRKHLGSFSHIVALDEPAVTRLKGLSATPTRTWDTPDPASSRLAPADRILVYRAVRNQLEGRIKGLLMEALQVVTS